MLKLLFIGFGGFLGAVARYGLSGLTHRWYQGSFPLGTLFVNLIGCFLIGLIMALVRDQGMFSPVVRSALTIGLLGAFTTYSSFAYETLALLSDQQYGLAIFNTLAQLVLGLAAVWMGMMVIRYLAG
jgi:CrcB protein